MPLMREHGSRWLLLSVAALGTLLSVGLARGQAPAPAALDAPDYPSSLTSASDGSVWVGLQTDTLSAVTVFEPDWALRKEFLVGVFEARLAMTSGDELVASGYGFDRSRYYRYDRNGRHQGSWDTVDTLVLDLDVAGGDELVSLEVQRDHPRADEWPLVADRLRRYAPSGRLLTELPMEERAKAVAAASDGSLHVAADSGSNDTQLLRISSRGEPVVLGTVAGRVVGMDFGPDDELFVGLRDETPTGRVDHLRVEENGAQVLSSWPVCHEPRDIAVTADSRILVLSKTELQPSASVSAVCEYDRSGVLRHEREVPPNGGRSVPTRTPRAGERAWMPLLQRGR